MIATLFHEVLRALSVSVAMGWEILWALILGFVLSGVVQAVVTKGEMSRLLPDSSPRTYLIASALGAASSQHVLPSDRRGRARPRRAPQRRAPGSSPG